MGVSLGSFSKVETKTLPIQFYKQASTQRAHRGIFSFDPKDPKTVPVEDLFQLDFPNPFKVTDHFTIFWRGFIDHDKLCEFMSQQFEPDELLATLFFFPQVELRLPPRPIEPPIPSPVEKGLLAQYGRLPDSALQFARYELYSKSISVDDDLRQSRLVGWAALPPPDNPSEGSVIGVFTPLTEIRARTVRESVLWLMTETVSVLRLDDAARGLDEMIKFMEGKLQ
jgi:hypothetical protein